ncbi:16348_t:CDS:2, partial [Gigaspora margarita]
TIEKQYFFLVNRCIVKEDVKKVLKKADFVLKAKQELVAEI